MHRRRERAEMSSGCKHRGKAGAHLFALSCQQQYRGQRCISFRCWNSQFFEHFQKGCIYFKLKETIAVKSAGMQKLLKRLQVLLDTQCFTSSDMGLLILADVPRDGEQVLLEHHDQAFSLAVALRTSERAEQMLGFWLVLLYLQCSIILALSPFGWSSLFHAVCPEPQAGCVHRMEGFLKHILKAETSELSRHGSTSWR